MSDCTYQSTRSAPRSDHGRTVESHPAFTCTICWQRQARGSQPKLLGSSARIVCKPCWRAVLDLSICWVCGECIVRGDEVISLGWCFWHRGCFGCLVCGTRLDVPAKIAGSVCSEGGRRQSDVKGEWGKWDGSGNEAENRILTRCIGVELEEVPLCSVCEVETAGESTGRVLERGLETVTKLDGGLSRDRLELFSEAKDRSRHRRAVRSEESLRGSLCLSTYHKNEPLNTEDMSPLLDNAADMGISEDGCGHDSNSHSDIDVRDLGSEQYCFVKEGTTSVVYVSVLDPVSQPAFRPSKTKSLPRWMNLLPINVHRERQQRRMAVDDTTRQSYEIEQARVPSSRDGSDDVDADTSVHGSSAVTPTGDGKKQGTGSLMVEAPFQKRLTIAFDPVPKGEDVSFRSRSKTGDLKPATAEGFSCSCLSSPQTPYPRTQYPTVSRPSITRNETSSYFSSRPSTAMIDDSLHESASDGVSQPGSSSSSNNFSPIRNVSETPEATTVSISPPQSSEYLTGHQPKRTFNARYEKYVAGGPEPILKKLKRRKAAPKENTDNPGEQHIDTKGKGKSLKLLDEEFGLDPRKEDLNKELRNLFCEE